MTYKKLSLVIVGMAAGLWLGFGIAHRMHENAQAPAARIAAMTDCEKREVKRAIDAGNAASSVVVTNHSIRILERICKDAPNSSATNH